MKPNNTTIKTLLLLLVLTSNILFAGYTLDTKYTTNGANSYDNVSKILKLGAYIYSDNRIKFEISKADGSRFATSGDIFLKVGSPETYGVNRNEGRILKNYYSKYFKHNLDDYSGYPKKFYGRYQSDNGGWMWVGPITVYKTDDKPSVSSVSPTSATLNKKTTFTVYGKNLTSSTAIWIDECVNKKSLGGNSTYRQFSCTPSYKGGNHKGKVYDKTGSDQKVLKNFSVNFIDTSDKTDPTGGLTTTIKSSYIQGSGITFGIRVDDNKKLKTISLNISKSTSQTPISSVSKTWSDSSKAFRKVYTVDTQYLKVGTYNYALWAKDDADNAVAVATGSFSITKKTVTPPTTSISKTLGVRYEQPICSDTTAPTVVLKELLTKAITYNGVKSASIEFEARVSGGSKSCKDSRGVTHQQHIFTAWKTDKGGFIDKTPSGSSYKYKKVQFIIPISQKDEYRIQLYVGDDLGKEIYKEYIKSNGKDTDGDGISDTYDFDDDNDGLSDYQESKYSFLNPLAADANKDYDGDGISNIDEINKYRTDPSKKDTDGDGVNDKEDKYPNDSTKSDDDKKVGNKWIGLKSKKVYSIKEEEIESKIVANFVIVSYKPRPTTPQAYTIYMQDEKGAKSILKSGKVILDQERWIEVKLPKGTKSGVYKVWGTVEINPKESNLRDNTSKIATITVIGKPLDTDGDGIPDKIDKDDDNDGISDVEEQKYGLNPLINDANQDKDGDGISNIDEIKAGLNPNNKDSDGDGVNDKEDKYPLDSTKSGDDEVITIHDERLLGCIRSTLKISTDKTPTTKQLLGMKKLYCKNKGLTDENIEEIGKLKNLERIYAYGNKFTNTDAFATLTKLTYLHLGRNQIEDVSGLEKLINLKYLYLYYNRVENIDVLSSLSRLYYLHLGGNKIKDISSLENLGNLKYLYLYKNQIEEIDALASTEKLYRLNIRDNKITNLSPLAHLNSLRYLYIDRNCFTDFSMLSSRVRVYGKTRQNDIRMCRETDDDIVINDSKLLSCVRSSLRISSSATPTTAQLLGLKKLNCTRKGLSNQNLAELKKMPNIERIYFYKNRIENLTPFAELRKLKRLDLNRNKVSDLTGVERLANLEYLKLYYNNIDDISYLKSLTKLKSLDLGSNKKISDISPLANLRALTYLSLYRNNIRDISALLLHDI